ncbi:MAG TPA: ATP-binding protein, partial [Blastocatellia bacterium]
ATKSEEDLFNVVCHRLGEYSKDLPFVLVYLFEGAGELARLACTHGAKSGDAIAPALINKDAADAVWPAQEILSHMGPVTVHPLAGRFDTIPSAPWDIPARQAVLMPIAQQGQKRPAGFLVAGINPYRPYDDAYRGFIDLLAGQIAAGLSNARAYEAERKRAEALAEIDRAKTTFFSNVSHEFRTPLTLMLGPLDDVLASPEARLQPDIRESLSVVRRNGQRLLKLVNTLLDFSRIEAGRVQAVYEPVDLAAFTAELASIFQSATEKAGMRLMIDCPALPEPVFVDRDLWEKIVLNLVSNAFKYTLEGEIRVSVRSENNFAVLSIQDTGIGIPEQELPSLFNRFHRVEGARGRTHEGTGIGLALVQELVKLHGGTVSVQSVHGKGSTFTVTIPFGHGHLPVDRIVDAHTAASTARKTSSFVEEALRWLPAADTEDEADSVSWRQSSGAEPSLADGERKNKLVLADDNADMRNYVRRLLADEYEVIAVADGQEALQAAATHKPDLVLTDVMMPKLDGFGLLKALRQNPQTSSIPVILLSARAGEEARVEGLQAGADDYLIKPFSARELLARVGGILTLAKARREAMRREEELKAETASVLESINEGFFALDQDFRITYANAQAERINGLRREDMIGKNHWELFPASLGTMVEKEFHRAMAERVPVKFENYYSPLERWFEVDVYPTKDGGVAVYFRDITGQKLAMEALQQADRRKDEFLATLAHELRNPLAPIRNGLQIMRLAGTNLQVQEQARAIMERQLQQMVRLIDDLLDLSRISRGKIELRKEPIELAAALQNAIETSLPLIEAAGHELIVELLPETVLLQADQTRLAQVFANLLNNAAKYTEKGGRIRLTAAKSGDEIMVSVKDNGVGIPASMLSQVFDMFTQVDRSLEKSRGGLGIGLSITKRLVEMHGGKVEAHSDGDGAGSEFVVRLPLPVLPTREADITQQTPSAPNGRRRILVADDNEDSASAMAMMLKLMGYEVRLASDGPEAIQRAEAFRPALILLDIGMPGMNGYDACRHIRQQPGGEEIVIAALTGWGQEEDKRRSRDAGFNYHLVKPVAPADLEKLLAAVESPPVSGSN